MKHVKIRFKFHSSALRTERLGVISSFYMYISLERVGFLGGGLLGRWRGWGVFLSATRGELLWRVGVHLECDLLYLVSLDSPEVVERDFALNQRTGPSFTRLTCIMAWNTPSFTLSGGYCARIEWRK